MGKKRPGQKKRIASERRAVLDVMVREGARDASETTGETTEEIGVMRDALTAVMTDVMIGASIAVTTDVTIGASIAVMTDVTTGALIAVRTETSTAVRTDATATEMKEVMKETPTGVTEATVKDGEREATDSLKPGTIASPEETVADTAM